MLWKSDEILSLKQLLTIMHFLNFELLMYYRSWAQQFIQILGTVQTTVNHYKKSIIV